MIDALDIIDERIRGHRDAIAHLVARRAEENVDLVVSQRELATIRAALYCWHGSYEQAMAEGTDWPEVEIASGGERQFKPLTLEQVDLLRRRLT